MWDVSAALFCGYKGCLCGVLLVFAPNFLWLRVFLPVDQREAKSMDCRSINKLIDSNPGQECHENEFPLPSGCLASAGLPSPRCRNPSATVPFFHLKLEFCVQVLTLGNKAQRRLAGVGVGRWRGSSVPLWSLGANMSQHYKGVNVVTCTCVLTQEKEVLG